MSEFDPAASLATIREALCAWPVPSDELATEMIRSEALTALDVLEAGVWLSREEAEALVYGPYEDAIGAVALRLVDAEEESG